MKIQPILPLLALVASIAYTAPARAADHEHAQPSTPSDASAAASAKTGHLDAPTEKDAAWLAKARAGYPMKTCLVSKEELGGMGEASEFIYRRDGQPDRLVRFCCDSCVDDFKKDPAKYLALLDGVKAKAGQTK